MRGAVADELIHPDGKRRGVYLLRRRTPPAGLPAGERVQKLYPGFLLPPAFTASTASIMLGLNRLRVMAPDQAGVKMQAPSGRRGYAAVVARRRLGVPGWGRRVDGYSPGRTRGWDV